MNHIVEIKSIEGLKELSSMGGGVHGHVNPKKNLDEEDLEEDKVQRNRTTDA